MNREIESLREKLFLLLIQCNPPKVVTDANSYHNGVNWNLQIDAVIGFSSQCSTLRKINPASWNYLYSTPY
jgi:hypothetical protein